MTYNLQTINLTKAEFTFVVTCLFDNQTNKMYKATAATPEYVQHLKEVCNQERPTFVHDSEKHALECIAEFGGDYHMYCSYLDQFRVTTTGEQVRFVPVSYKVYNKLYDNDLTTRLLEMGNAYEAEFDVNALEETRIPF